jgi:hypothetical protein
MLFEASPSMVDQGEEFTGTIRLKRFQKNYVKNPNQVDDAIRKARPHKTTYQVDDLQVKLKQYNYIRNPSSAEDALKVREPGKAFGRSTDYQGNIKMKKFDLFEKHNRELHPDSKFVKINKNNVRRRARSVPRDRRPTERKLDSPGAGFSRPPFHPSSAA